MNRYLIETPHENEDCKQLVKQISAAGYLRQFDWGCADGVHNGWAIIEAESREQAAQIVPWSVRKKARIIMLNKFDEVDPLHHE